MQALGKTGPLGTFAFAGGRALRPAKNCQEVGVRVKAVVRKLHRASAWWQSIKLRLRLDDLVDRIEQHLSREPTRIKSREIVAVGSIELVWNCAQLVSRRGCDGPHQLL